jgi:hypothetical protein
MAKKKGVTHHDDNYGSKSGKKERGTSKAESFAAHQFQKGGKRKGSGK